MPEPVEFISAIQKALQDLRYGTVQLVVHDGQLVRIERTERIRLPSEEKLNPADRKPRKPNNNDWLKPTLT